MRSKGKVAANRAVSLRADKQLSLAAAQLAAELIS